MIEDVQTRGPKAVAFLVVGVVVVEVSVVVGVVVVVVIGVVVEEVVVETRELLGVAFLLDNWVKISGETSCQCNDCPFYIIKNK